MKEQDIIKTTYQRMYQGMVDKDRDLLTGVLDDSFTLIHMTGMCQGKEAFIRAVEDGTLNYFSASHQQMDVNIEGDNASLVGKSLVSAAVFGGGQHTWRLQLRLTLTRKNGSWKITEAMASTY